MLNTIPKQLEMDYSVILNKPFFIKNITWANTAVEGTRIANLNIPIDILTNPLVRIPFEASVYFRAKISVVFQVAGTPMHSGCLIATALPVGGDNMWVAPNSLLNMNQYLVAPHVFLSANEATPVMLEVPFYVNSKLAPIAINNTTVVPGPAGGDTADVIIAVVNPMGVPTGGTNSLTISAHFIFNDLEFYVPHVDPVWQVQSFVAEGFVESTKGFITNVFDRVTSGVKTTVSDAYDLISSTKVQAFDLIDSGRAWIRGLTGLHNPADTTISTKVAVQYRQNTNVVDAPIQLEKLDPYSQFSHYTRDFTFDTDIDEMLVSEIISKPQYIGKFTLKNTNTSGQILWTRPITPFQQVVDATYTRQGQAVDTIATTSVFQNLHYLSRYWKGSLKVHIQSVMSNFHYCKLTLARNYSPDQNMITSIPAFDSVPNLMMETLEFSGHQVHTVELPYASCLEQLPCTSDPLLNALQHGMYYIYVHQPLVVNGTIPTSVEFNIYLSAGDDFQFYGYASRPIQMGYRVNGTPLFSGRTYDEDGVLVQDKVSIEPSEKTKKLEEKEGTILTFAAEAAVEDQSEILLKEHEQSAIKPTDLRPIVSVRDYLRRFNRGFYRRYTNAELDAFRGAIQVDVAELLGVRGPTGVSGTPGTSEVFGACPQQLINAMFLGYSGGARFKIGVMGTTMGEVYYVPPGFHNFNTDITGNRQWRSTQPFTDLLTAPTAGPFASAIGAQYLFAEKSPNAYADVDMLSPLPMQERPNYLMTSADQDVGLFDGTTFNRMAMSTSVHEVEVPHMSPFRFVGDASKGMKGSSGNYSLRTATSDMGYLIIKLAQPLVYYPGTTDPIQTSVALEIFVAADDVGRAGYQTFAPLSIVPAVRVPGAGASVAYYQIGPDCIESSSLVYPSYPSTFKSPPVSAIPAFDYTKSLYRTGP
jgi:hypothetical protein